MPDEVIVKIERRGGRDVRRGYEVKLTNGTEPDFDRSSRLADMDR